MQINNQDNKYTKFIYFDKKRKYTNYITYVAIFHKINYCSPTIRRQK